MKKITRIIATCLFAFGISGSSANADLKSITIGTNPAGSTFFLLGGGIAKMYQEKLGIRSTAQPQDGSSIYLPMINSGEMTLGLSSSMDGGFAYKGDGFPKVNEELRTLGRIWILPYAFITSGASGITKVEDLKGKRVMGNMPTNVALTRLNKAILKGGGLSPEDVDFARSGGLLDGIRAVVEGRADAAPVATTMPQLIEANGAADGGIVVIANGSGATKSFYNEQVPGTRLGVAKPSSRRPFIVQDTNIVNYDTLLMTSSKLSEDDAYRLTKALYENWDQLRKDYPPLRSVAQDQIALVASTVPYHSGAVRFFKEIGVWSDAHQANQDSLK